MNLLLTWLAYAGAYCALSLPVTLILARGIACADRREA